MIRKNPWLCQKFSESLQIFFEKTTCALVATTIYAHLFCRKTIYATFFVRKKIHAHFFCDKNNFHTLFCYKNDLRTLSRKFLRVETCHSESLDFLASGVGLYSVHILCVNWVLCAVPYIRVSAASDLFACVRHISTMCLCVCLSELYNATGCLCVSWCACLCAL